MCMFGLKLEILNVYSNINQTDKNKSEDLNSFDKITFVSSLFHLKIKHPRLDSILVDFLLCLFFNSSCNDSTSALVICKVANISSTKEYNLKLT